MSLECGNGPTIGPVTISWTFSGRTMETGGACDPFGVTPNSAGTFNIDPKTCPPVTLGGKTGATKSLGGVVDDRGTFLDVWLEYEVTTSSEVCLAHFAGTLTRQ